ncbi:MAG: putative manganese transporter [Clostridia bacterium]|nr:putative manganese transporter [Clostridia bacterium]
MLDVVLDAVIDTVKLLPFLFVTYLLMEWLEHKTSEKTKNIIRNSGKFGPVIGGLLGAVPQCGFSAAASNLYAGRVITVGTLVAIFLSTSDEMLPIMISEQIQPGSILGILGIKILIGVIAGFAIDSVIGKKQKVEKIEVGIGHVCRHDHCHCDKSVVKSSLKHTAVIMIFIFVISLALNMLLFFVGEEALAGFILDRPVLGPVLSALVGLIPNCAASVVITQLFIEGVISFGSMMAGLLAGSGVGLLVLFKVNDNWKDNVKIMAVVYVIGTVCGIAMNLLAG